MFTKKIEAVFLLVLTIIRVDDLEKNIFKTLSNIKNDLPILIFLFSLKFELIFYLISVNIIFPDIPP